MKKIWNYLIQHLREDFQIKRYGLVAILLSIAIYLNFKYDFEDSFLDAQEGFTKFIYYFLFFSAAYYTVVLICTEGTKPSFWFDKTFWIKSVLALAALSLDSSLPFLRPMVNELVTKDLQLWVYKVCVNLISLLTIFLPFLIYYFIWDKKEKHVYGLNSRQFDARPYFIMLGIMIPLMIAASFHPSFIRQYPMYRGGHAAEALDVSVWVTTGIYELVYGIDFVTVEFFFRGFLVIGMMSLIGRKAVISMAAVYCLIHFGKPPGEAISSIFGGYILGVIAYETKSIWGGIIVHVGIAWAMELIGFIQRNHH